MELGKQLKKYRNEKGLSQDALAEKVFVSRQTISNWENDKSYPDVKSLLILSEVFHVSLDYLIKGDVEEMKQHIQEEERKEFNKSGNIFTILLISFTLLAIPLVHFFSYVGLGMAGLLYAVTLFYGYKVDKQKKQYDIQSFKEIVAFMEGKSLNSTEKAQENVKRPYQTIIIVFSVGIIAAIVAFATIWLLNNYLMKSTFLAALYFFYKKA